MPKIGAHVSAAISLERAFDKALEIGAECTQFFISPPRQWAKSKHDEIEIQRYKDKAKKTQIGPNFIHGTYLVNLGTQNPEHLQKSIDWLIYAVQMAAKLGSRGVIFHLGSHKGVGFEAVKNQIVSSLNVILEGAKRLIGSRRDSIAPARTSFIASLQNDSLPYLILENSVGAGGTIGSSLQELGWILNEVQGNRLKICLDTQHAFAFGYDLKTPIGLKDFLEEFELEIGLENLAAIHANDSKVEYKAFRDRHENIGEGFIGKDGFTNLINNPKLANVPFILEVPGFAGNGPDKENVDFLKSLRGS